MADNQKFEQKTLDLEFTHEPVPQEYRKSFAIVAGTWFGYPMSLTNAIFGGMIVGYLGLKDGLLAILVGALLLFAYVGVLSYRAGKTGMNFPLMAKTSFGTKGYMILTAFLATTGIGWFAFQTGLTGNMIHSTFGINEHLMTALGGIFYIVLVYLGIKALSIIGWFAAPMFLILSIIAVIIAMQQYSFTDILNYQPATRTPIEVFSMGAAISVVFGAFSDAGTMTADYTRWGKNGRHALWAAFTAFPVADFIGYAMGGIIVATGIILNPIKDGGNFMLFLTGLNPILSIMLFLFIFINLGASCSHCLYNGAITWANITKAKLKTMIAIIGGIGTIIALAGVWGLFPYWLNLLGICIPPVGGIMILDQLFFRKRFSENIPAWKLMPFISWVIASIVASIVYLKAPYLSYAVIGVITAMLIHTVSVLTTSKKNVDKASVISGGTL
jgi:cytosine permease